jgi:hypothetical protein
MEYAAVFDMVWPGSTPGGISCPCGVLDTRMRPCEGRGPGSIPGRGTRANAHKMQRLVGDNRMEEDDVPVCRGRSGVCDYLSSCVMAFEAGDSVRLYFLYAGDDLLSVYRVRKQS